MKVDLRRWLAASPCAVPPLPSWRRARGQGKEERKYKTRCSLLRKLVDTLVWEGGERGSGREPGRKLRGGGQSCAHGRLARLSLWPTPARPPGCAPALPLSASPGLCRGPRRRGRGPRGQPPGGRARPALVLRPDVSRLAPPLGCGGHRGPARFQADRSRRGSLLRVPSPRRGTTELHACE